MSLLTVVKWCGLVVIGSAIEVVYDGVDFLVVFGGVVGGGLVGGVLVEGFSAVRLLSDRVSDIIIFTHTFSYRSTPTFRYYRMRLSYYSLSGIGPLIKLLSQPFLYFLLSHY